MNMCPLSVLGVSCVLGVSVLGVSVVIGASLSEPYTSESNGGIFIR